MRFTCNACRESDPCILTVAEVTTVRTPTLCPMQHYHTRWVEMQSAPAAVAKRPTSCPDCGSPCVCGRKING